MIRALTGRSRVVVEDDNVRRALGDVDTLINGFNPDPHRTRQSRYDIMWQSIIRNYYRPACAARLRPLRRGREALSLRVPGGGLRVPGAPAVRLVRRRRATTRARAGER